MGIENHVGSFDVQMKHLNPLLPPIPEPRRLMDSDGDRFYYP
jgi:hypothetical protein